MKEVFLSIAYWLPIIGAASVLFSGVRLRGRGEKAGVWLIGAALVWLAAFVVSAGGGVLIEALRESGEHKDLAFIGEMEIDIVSNGLLAIGIIVLFFSIIVDRMPEVASEVKPEEYARTMVKRAVEIYRASKRR